MDKITIVNVGTQPITCEDVSQNGQPLMKQRVVIQGQGEKTVHQGNSGGEIRIKVGVGNCPSFEQEAESDRSTMPQPRLSNK